MYNYPTFLNPKGFTITQKYSRIKHQVSSTDSGRLKFWMIPHSVQPPHHRRVEPRSLSWQAGILAIILSLLNTHLGCLMNYLI